MIPGKIIRSGGPNTLTGKQVAARNSYRHGAYASTALFDYENETDFYRIIEELNDSFRPKDTIGRQLVQELAEHIWRKIRLVRLEASHLQLMRKGPLRSEELALLGDEYGEFLPLANECSEITIDRGHDFFEKIIIDLDKLVQQFGVERVDPKHVKRCCPELYEALLQITGDTPVVIDASLAAGVFGGSRKTGWGVYIEQLRAYVDREVRRLTAYHHVMRARNMIFESRMLEFMLKSSTQRAHEDLQRSFVRTLEELRRHLDWQQTATARDQSPKDKVTDVELKTPK